MNSSDYVKGVPKHFRELAGLRVIVERVVFVPHLDAPPEKPYPFVYFIEIRNESTEWISIRGRKWIVEDSGGEKTIVEGRGVVGETPTLNPGENFQYNSYHVVARSSKVSGSFFGVDSTGKGVRVSIPEFHLEPPNQE